MLISEITEADLTPEIIDRILFQDITDTGENADCILVLGSAKAAKYRIPVAVQAYKAGRANKIMLCGGKLRDFPEGKFSEQSMKYANELGYKTVFWSFAYADWDNARQPSPEAAKKKILDNVHNGEVMLLHPTSATNAEILGDIIRELKSQGFRFGTLDELCGDPRLR